MNSLSWFLYFADVASSFAILLACVSLFGGLILIITSAIYAVENDKFWWQGWKVFAPICLSAALIACAIPSRQTIYAIAASQVGERLVQNETVKGIANDATKALQIWIKKQVETERKQSKQ